VDHPQLDVDKYIKKYQKDTHFSTDEMEAGFLVKAARLQKRMDGGKGTTALEWKTKSLTDRRLTEADLKDKPQANWSTSSSTKQWKGPHGSPKRSISWIGSTGQRARRQTSASSEMTWPRRMRT